MFVKITNGQVEKYPYTIGEFRKAHPNKSFPKDIPTNILEADGVFVIQETAQPTIDINTQIVSWSVEFKGGAWTQVWTTTQLPEETAANNVRIYRDALLESCDWTQVADAPVNKESWATYRQALRDIPSQVGFPYSVNWPEKP